ncbi:MAG: caspase family protein [Burkholderiaceae bacterium]
MPLTDTLRAAPAWGAFALFALLAPQAFGQQAYTPQFFGATLYAEPDQASAKLAEIRRGERVELVQRQGVFWLKVRGAGREGWVSRAAMVRADDEPATAPVVAAAPAAPQAAPPAASIAPAAPPSPAAAPARAAIPRGHAVVFGISEYEAGKGIPTLKGVPRDMHSANAMAQIMGITPDRITTLRDREVTKASMSAVLTQLAREVRPGDPVLLYYSGHGGRVADPNSAGRCIEGLITHEGELLTNTEMSALLRPLAETTDGLFVFFDSCHSGGLSSTRATGDGRFTPKFVARSGASNCAEIVNMLQSPPPGTRTTGNKYVYAAAARANEISLDDEVNGGLATSNFLRCMADGSNATVDAIRACAQAGIERQLAGNPLFKPHNMTITGDLATAPARLAPPARTQLLARAQAGTLVAGGSAASIKAVRVSSQLGAKGWPQIVNPQQAFAAVTAKADKSAVLTVEAPRTLKIDTEPLRLKATAPADGYFYIVQAGSDGKGAVLLYPNMLDRDNRVAAGQSIELPRAAWPLVAAGPEGENHLLVVFSRAPRDLSQLVGQEAGPFLDLAVSPTGMQALAYAMSRSAFEGDGDCQGAGAVAAHCQAPYSAEMRTIREVR